MIAAIVLAAGAARRMGRLKQLLLLADRPLVWHAADAARRAGLDEVIVVTGSQGAAVAAAVADLPVRPVYNPGWRAGQASSLRAGLAAVAPQAGAVVFLLADQPLVTPRIINALTAAWRAGGSIVVPAADGRRGNPVLFDLGRWRQPLAALTGDAGARGIIAANPEDVVTVEVADEAILFDVDTPEDFVALQELYLKRKGR